MAIEFPGSRQILAERRRLLAEYDRARTQARSHEVETHHGNVAESLVREWLERFLPKRFGVTSGYIVSQLPSQGRLPHFDVIIYEQLDAPVLWIEDYPDKRDMGSSRAIPVEYVRAVIEVKAALNSKTSHQSMEHLADLLPQLDGFDSPAERYRKHFRHDFFCLSLFIELRASDAGSRVSINNLLPLKGLRGYLGAAVLRGEGLPEDHCGEFRLLTGDNLKQLAETGSSLLTGGVSFAVPINIDHPTENSQISGMLMWNSICFSKLVFDLVALLNGTYEIGRVSSFYGLTTGAEADRR